MNEAKPTRIYVTYPTFQFDSYNLYNTFSPYQPSRFMHSRFTRHPKLAGKANVYEFRVIAALSSRCYCNFRVAVYCDSMTFRLWGWRTNLEDLIYRLVYNSRREGSKQNFTPRTEEKKMRRTNPFTKINFSLSLALYWRLLFPPTFLERRQSSTYKFHFISQTRPSACLLL